ncbi:MAG: DMT family transporter [Allosphingosinicella sp.]
MTHNARFALILALCGFSSLALGDAVVKTMAGAWPGTGVAALRYSIGAVGLGAVVGAVQGRSGFALPRPWLQVGRGSAAALATICFFMAVMALPLADATAIQFTSPMITGILSALVLGERAPRAVWGATALAFVGVLIVLRPNMLALGAAALWPLGAAFGMAWLMILNRKSVGIASPLAMQLLLAATTAPILIVAATLFHLSGAPRFQVPPPTVEVVLKCAFVALTATTGHLLIYSATVRASAAVVAPMTYVQLIFATGLGWVLFGNAPDVAMLAGAALIIAGGLWLWRSQKPSIVPETPD